jgi:hypothetical protein
MVSGETDARQQRGKKFPLIGMPFNAVVIKPMTTSCTRSPLSALCFPPDSSQVQRHLREKFISIIPGNESG